jgi:hypothetical protein
MTKIPIRHKLSSILLSSSLLVGSAGAIAIPALTLSAPPASAAGFMEKSFKNWTGNSALDDNMKNGIKIFGALVYWIPPVGIVGSVFAMSMASKSTNEDLPKNVLIGISLTWALIIILWIYDSKLVGDVNAKLPPHLLREFVKLA